MLERQGGRYVYNSQQREQTLSAQTLSVGVGTGFSFTPTYSGEYEVRVSRPGASSYVAHALLRLRQRRHAPATPSR
ncbi:MAG: hypothetical protein WKG07_10120 [Hymenobacter sp.]